MKGTLQSARLLYVLIVRDVKLRYKQTAGGFLWAILQPLMLMAVFTLLFSRILGVESDVPYPLFAFAGLLPWTVFSTGLTRSTTSLVTDALLVKKSNVPRILLPLAGVLAPLADFAPGFLVFLGMLLYWGVFSATILLALPFVGLACVFAFGLGLWLSAINVEYRDVAWALPMLVWMAMLVSPVAYGTAITQASNWYWVYELNPMAASIEGFRWAAFGGPFPEIWKSSLLSVLVLVSGWWFFRRREKIFADVA